MAEVIVLLILAVGIKAEQVLERIVTVMKLVDIFKLGVLDADSSIRSAFYTSDGDAEAYICQKELTH